jgi:hypothetical protein
LLDADGPDIARLTTTDKEYVVIPQETLIFYRSSGGVGAMSGLIRE